MMQEPIWRKKIVESGHDLNLDAQEHPTVENLPAKVECVKCKQSCFQKAIYKWLAKPCKPISYSRGGTGVARAEKGRGVQVGNSELHSSHSLTSASGVGTTPPRELEIAGQKC